jgi:hypothetical protein
MSDTDSTPIPSWREIAKQTVAERDPSKTLELAEELIRALDAESRQHMDQVKADDKAKENAA